MGSADDAGAWIRGRGRRGETTARSWWADRRYGSWYLRLELPVGSDGRRRRILRGGFTTRKAAEEALARVRAPSGSGDGMVKVRSGSSTGWPAIPMWRPPLVVREAHASLPGPYLGTVVLAELSVAHLQAVFATIVRHHQAEERG
ncbi:Arm DNA-binding domain-containing protein [Spirillospora sp. NBC_00431]